MPKDNGRKKEKGRGGGEKKGGSPKASPHRFRQRPTFPQPRGCSIIGPGGLNGRVRDGNGWIPSGMATGKSSAPPSGGARRKREAFPNKDEELHQAARPISTGTLKPLQALHAQPINLVVYQGSSGRLRGGISYLEVGFPLRCFQQFSRPDIATRPAVGTTAGTLEVSPSRSSRTRDRSSQISNAHNR